MRRFKMCVLFLIAIIVVTQVAIAQQSYNLDSYVKDYKIAYASADGVVSIQGQVFRPTEGGMYYLGYEGVELTLDGGADFTQTVVTGTEGEFAFTEVPVGSYTIFAHNSETNAFGSVNISLSKGQVGVSAQSKTTTFTVSSLKLLFTEDNLFILGRPSDPSAVNAVCEVGAVPMEGASAGYGGAFGGNMGMLAAGLGAAGLATGVAALASKDSKRGNQGGGWKPPRPVSRGTWQAR